MEERNMIPGLYSAATAMDASNRRQEVVSENLANLQIPGYRRRVMGQSSFDTLLQPMQGGNASSLRGSTPDEVHYDFSQGHIEETKHKLDMALNGEGFFTVQGPDGPLYTRSGAFHVDTQGTLVTVDGMPVQGTNGLIQIPGDSSTSQIEIAKDGSIYAGTQRIGQLAIVQFADSSVLSSAGASLFSASPGAVKTDSAAEVLQGRLEMSNTSSVTELISLIAVSRQRDAAQKALMTLSESIQKRIGLR